MANANARINIDINTSAAAAGLRNLQSQITAFNSTLTKSSAVQATAMRNGTQNLLELVNASRFFTAETVKMQTAASALDKTLSKGQVTIGQFFSAKFRKDSLAAAQVMSLANTRAQALQTQFVATGAAANGMRDAIAIRPLQAFNDAAVVSAQKLAIHRAMLQQATTQMINFGKNTQWAGRQLMVGFTVPLTIFGGIAGKTFRELEREAVNFKKVYGDAFTPPAEMEENLAAVQELAKEYTKYGIAVKDTVALAAQAAAAGAQNKDLLDATTQSTRLATLGQMEQNQALETTISLQSAFKLSGDDLAKSINFLNMVENQTVVTLQDLSAAIPRVAPVIKGLGGSVEDLAVMLAALQEGGVTAEQGANALKSGLASLINPTDRAIEKLSSLGISLDSIIQMNRGDLMGTVQGFAEALATLDTFTRQQALETVFGKFQYARLGALFDNIIRDGSQASRVLELTGLSAAEMAASAEKELGAIEEAVGTKFTAAMEKLKLAIAPIGEMFTKMAIPVLNFFGSIIEKFNQLPDFAKNFLGLSTVIVGIVIPAGTMFLGLLMNLIGTLVKFGSLVGIAFKGFTSGGIKGAFDAVTQAIGYMSLVEMDAVNSAQQLGISAEAVNKAFLEQVTTSDGAQAAIMELAYAYEILTNQMLEAAVANELAFSVGVGAMGEAEGTTKTRGPRVRRNRGGTIPGSGNTDTVPAMLTPGEFVVNKQATKDNLSLLRAINDGSKIPGFNQGSENAVERAHQAGVGSRPLALGAGQQSVRNPSPMNFDGEDFIPLSSAEQRIAARTSRKYYSQLLEHKGDTKNVAALRYAIEQLGMSPSDLRLTGRSTYGFLLSKDANKLMMERTLSREILERELLERNALYPIRKQLQNYVGHQLDDQKFLNILNQELDRTSIKNGVQEPISNKNFEQASGRAIHRYLSEETRIPPQTRTNFLKAIFAKREISANLSVPLLEQKLAAAGIPKVNTPNRNTAFPYYTGQGKDIKVETSTGTVSMGRLTGQEVGTLPKPMNLPRFRQFKIPGFMQRGIATVFAHGRNSGGIIPGTGNTDTVPTMLTPGEFIINKQATKSNIDFLRAINEGKIKFNNGGMVPGIRGYMAGARVNPLFKEMERRRAAVAVAKGKSIDDIIFARGSDKKLNASAFDLLTLLKHNPNLTTKELQRIQKYHGKRIKDGVFGRLDPQFGVRFRDSDSPTWRDVAKLLDERGFPVIQKRNQGGQIFESGGRAIVPGVGNTDTVPAMLTPGEFVVNKKATQSNMAFLKAINDGKFKGYELGGIVEALPGQYLVEGRDGRTFGPMPYDQAVARSKQLVSRRARSRLMRGQGTKLPRRGIGMGASMLGMGAMMGGMMIPGVAQNPAASTAMFAGGMALQTLPMMMGGMGGILAPLAGLAAPLAAVAAGLAVAGVAAYKWRDSVDSAARKAAEFGSNLGGTANAFNEIAALMGTQTPAQRQAALQMGFGQEEQAAISEEFQNIFGTEQGQAFIKELEEATSEDRFKKLSDYLKAGIAAGIMDKEMATGLAKAVSLTLGDTILGARTVGAISQQGTGAGAVLDIAQARSESVSSLKEFTRVVQEEGRLLNQADAATIIGGSIQSIQDFSNASALAREQLAAGEITQEEYNRIIEQSESQQALFTKAIEESLMHTTDFGGTMQGTLDQLTKAGLATEEGLNKLREAAEAAAFSNVVGDAGSQQNLMAAGISAIAAGMSEGAAAETLNLIGEEGSRAQQVFTNLSGQVGGSQALQTAALASQISTGQLFGESAKKFQANALSRQVEQFGRGGGDIIGLQSMLLSQGDLEQRVGLAEQFFSLSEQDKQSLLNDYQELGSSVGTEFANKIIQGDKYKEALKTGTSDELIKGITEASSVFGEKTEEMFQYAERSGTKIEDLVKKAKDLQSLPEEAIFRLGIDITNSKDLEKFGPIADDINANWPILSKLPEEINLNAFVNANINENGQLASSEDLANAVIKVRKAMADLDSVKPNIVKNAAVNIMVSEGMSMTDAKAAFDNIISGMEDFNNFEVEDKFFVIQAAVDLYNAIKALEALQQVNSGDLDGGIRALRIAQEQNVQEAQERVTSAELAGGINISGGRRNANGGGGGGEKSIIDELKNQFKSLQDTYSSIKRFIDSKTGEFKNVVSGPFAPQFIEFLKSQGEKGLAILNGNLNKLKAVYQEYKKVQIQEVANFAQTLPASLMEQAKVASTQNSIARELINASFPPETADMIAEKFAVAIASGSKKARNQLNRLINIGPEAAQAIVGTEVEFNLDQQERELLAVEKILKQIPGASQQTIDSLISLGINSGSSASQIRNAAASLDELAAKAYAAQPALTKLSNSLNAQASALQAQLSFNQYTVIAPMEDALAALQMQLNGLDRAVEMKQRSIRNIQREIELEERLKEPIEDRIKELEEEQRVVDENYDSTIESLEKVEKINERIARQRQGRLDVASALSRGDVAAAAQAALEMQRTMAELRQEETREGIDASFDEQRKNIEEAIRVEREKIAEIDERIEQKQLSIRAIQDEIFEIESQRLALQDAIYQKQMEIEAAKRRQLEIERQIARIQMVQSMIETQQQIYTAAQRGDAASLGFLQQQLGFQSQAMEFDAEGFATIPGIQPVLDLTKQILTSAQGSAEQIKAAFDKAGFALTGKMGGQGQEQEQGGGIEQRSQEITDAFATSSAIITGGEAGGGKDGEGKKKEKETAGGIQKHSEDIVSTMKDSVTEVQKLTGGQDVEGAGILPEGVAIIDEQMTFVETEFKKLPIISSKIVSHIEAAERSLSSIATALSNIKIPSQVGMMYGGIVRRAFGGMINYKGSRETAPGMMMGGKVKKFAFGSIVPGIGMTDTVPAMLTPGEFVIRKSVAKTMLPELKAMNSQVFPGMGVPQVRNTTISTPQFDTMKKISANSVRFGVPQNINSYVYPSTSTMVSQTNLEASPVTTVTGPTTVQYNYNLNVSTRTDASAEEIANTVMYKIKNFDSRKIRGTQIG